MNIHKSQLFWGSLGTRVLTHPQFTLQEGREADVQWTWKPAWPEWCLDFHIQRYKMSRKHRISKDTRLSFVSVDNVLSSLQVYWNFGESDTNLAMCRCNTFPVYASMFCSSCVSFCWHLQEISQNTSKHPSSPSLLENAWKAMQQLFFLIPLFKVMIIILTKNVWHRLLYFRTPIRDDYLWALTFSRIWGCWGDTFKHFLLEMLALGCYRGRDLSEHVAFSFRKQVLALNNAAFWCVPPGAPLSVRKKMGKAVGIVLHKHQLSICLNDQNHKGPRFLPEA